MERISTKSADDLLRIGAEKGSVELIQDALKRGADTESTGTSTWTPLMTVAEGGNVKAAEVLINAGANVDYKNIKGTSPLLVAVIKNNVKMAEFLLKCGAKIDANYRGDTRDKGDTMKGYAKTEEMKELLDRYDPKTLCKKRLEAGIERKQQIEEILDELNNDKKEV